MKDLNLKVVLSLVKEQFESAISAVRGRLGEFNQSANNAGAGVSGLQGRIKQSVGPVFDLGGAVKAAVAGFSVLALISGAKELIGFADNLRLVEGRIKNASDGTADFAKNYAQLAAISYQTSTSLAENANVFARLNPGIKEMGGNSQDTLRQVDLLAKSLRISNASQAESASIIRQWAQAMASGVVRGDEFNSVMENAPRIQQALTASLGVSVGELRKMAEAGELTSARVAQALAGQGKAIDDEYEKIPLTVGAAFEKIKTAFGQYVADADRSAGATAGFASTLDGLSKNIIPVADGLLTLAKLAAAVGFGSLVSGVTAYIGALKLAKAEAAALAAAEEAARAAMLAKAQAALAAAEATVADTTLKTLNIGATQGIIAALGEEALSRLAVASATINQQRAAVAAIATNAASTETTALLAAATQGLVLAEQHEAIILADLEAIRLRSLQTTADLAAAQVAQAEAATVLTAAQGRLAGALKATETAGLATKLTLSTLINPAMWGYAIYLLGEYLSGFKEFRLGAVVAVDAVVSALADLEYHLKKAKLLWEWKITWSDEGEARIRRQLADLDAEFSKGAQSRKDGLDAVFDYELQKERELADNKPSSTGSKGGFSSGETNNVSKQQAQEANKLAKELLDSQLAQIKTKQDALKTASELELKQLDTNFKAAELNLKQQGLGDIEFKQQRLELEKTLAAQILEVKRKLVLDSAALEQQAINAKIKAVQSEVVESKGGGNLKATKFDSAFSAATEKYNLPPNLLKAVAHQETGGSFKTDLKSPAGAVGLMQFMPPAAQRFGVADRTNPDQSIEGAAKYFRFLLDKFKGNVGLALAGYNAGEGAVEKHGNQIPPYKETQNYVKNISANLGKGKDSPEDQQAKNAKLEALNAQLVANKAETTAQLKSLGLDESQAEIAQQEQAFEVKKALSEQEKALAVSTAEAEQAAKLDGLAAAEAASQQQLALGLIDNEQHLANLRSFADQRLAIELGLVEAKRDLLGKEKLALAKNTADEMAIRRKAAAEISGIDNKIALDKQAEFDKLFAPFENALDGMVSGVLTGQQTIKNAVRNAARSITVSYVAEFIKTRARSAAEWAWQVAGFAGVEAKKKAIKNGGFIYDGLLWVANKAKMAAGWVWETLGFGAKETAKASTKVVSEGVQTDAQLTGDGMRAGSSVVAAGITEAANADAAQSSLSSFAVSAAGGAYSALAMIPIIGPLLGAVAAVVAFAGVMAFSSLVGSAKGGEWEVGEDGSPYILHEKESVLPAGVADNFRKVVGIVQGHVAPQPKGIQAFNALQATGAIPKALPIPRFALDMANTSQTAANQLAQSHARANKDSVGGDSLVGKGKSGGDTYNIHTFDTHDFEGFLMKNGGTVAKVLKNEHRKFNAGGKR